MVVFGLARTFGSVVSGEGNCICIAFNPADKPRTKKPPEMSVEEWQLALRREFGREQRFKIKNLGNEPVFSEFQVATPESGGAYRVAIRGRAA